MWRRGVRRIIIPLINTRGRFYRVVIPTIIEWIYIVFTKFHNSRVWMWEALGGATGWGKGGFPKKVWVTNLY
jgi:hypothetical protein